MTRTQAWDLTIEAMRRGVAAEMECAHATITEAAGRAEYECRIKVRPEAEHAVRAILHEEGFRLAWVSPYDHDGTIGINWRPYD